MHPKFGPLQSQEPKKPPQRGGYNKSMRQDSNLRSARRLGPSAPEVRAAPGRRNQKSHLKEVAVISRCDRIRTCDLCVPNAALYQTEPRIVNQR